MSFSPHILSFYTFSLLLANTVAAAPTNTNVITVVLNVPVDMATTSTANLSNGQAENPSGVAKKKMLEILRRIVQSKEMPKLAIHAIQEGNANTVMAALCYALAAERATAVGSLPPSVTDLVASLAHTFALPYITWDSGLKTGDIQPTEPIPALDRCHIFSVRPGVTQPLLDFLSAWNWKSFAYLYGSEEAFERLKLVLHHAYNEEAMATRSFVSKAAHTSRSKSDPRTTLSRITHAYIDIDSTETMHKSLTAVDFHLSSHAERNVIIDLGSPPVDVIKNSREHLTIVFMWLARMGMMRAEYNYLLIDFDLFELNLEPYQRSGVNITGFHLLDYNEPEIAKFAEEWRDLKMPLHDAAFMLDAMELARQLKKATNSVSEESEEKPKCYTQRGTLVTKNQVHRWKPGEKLSKWLLEQEILGQSGIIRYDSKTCQRTGYSLMLSAAFGAMQSRTIAKWSLHSGWVLPSYSSMPSFFNRRHPHALRDKIHEPINYNNILEIFKLQNRTLRVVSILSKPFMMHANNVPATVRSGRDNFVGFCKDLADKIFDQLDLNYELHMVKDGLFGAIDPMTNEWNGMVSEVLRDEADLIIAPLTMSIIRAKVIDFSEPFMNFGLSLMIRKPGKTKPGMFSFLSPLTNEVWLCCAAATVVVGLALRLIAAISPRELMRPDIENLGFSLGNSMWYSFASFVHQGLDIFPLSPGARIFASIWRYFCLVIMAYYTANLAAALSVERVITPINSIKDFAERKDLMIKIGTLDSGSTKDFFSTANDPIYKKIYEVMTKDTSAFVPTMQAGFDKVRSSQYAFVVESKMNEYVNHRRPCDTMLVGNTFGSKAYAIAVSSKKPDMRILKEHATDAILRLRENQVLAKMYKEWWIEKGECIAGKEESTSEPLALVNLSGVFYILIAGFVLAIITGVSIFAYQFKHADRLQRAYRQISNGFTADDSSL